MCIKSISKRVLLIFFPPSKYMNINMFVGKRIFVTIEWKGKKLNWSLWGFVTWNLRQRFFLLKNPTRKCFEDWHENHWHEQALSVSFCLWGVLCLSWLGDSWKSEGSWPVCKCCSLCWCSCWGAAAANLLPSSVSSLFVLQNTQHNTLYILPCLCSVCPALFPGNHFSREVKSIQREVFE